MKYSIATILCNGLESWQIDVIQQDLADLGFDSFEQDDTILRAYSPSDIADTPSLQNALIASGATLQSFEACPDENWNAVWEASHEVEELPLGVRITPHCAFGAGHHETTAMMIDELINSQHSTVHRALNSQHSTVLDMGTGTGVLAIMAAKLGAQHVLAVDIDDNSVRNARENAIANGVDIEVRQGATVPQGSYILIMANIHRNILLAQMPDYARYLIVGGELWLSGFYETDIPALVAAAAEHGLQHTATRQNGDWRMIILHK